MKKLFLPFLVLVTLVIIVGGVFLFSKEKGESETSPLPSSYEYFWGDGCPHCANVEDFFSSWDGRDKISIDKKEVWNDRKNALLMRERAIYCKLPLNTLGVPFLFTPEGECLEGDEAIIELFKGLEL